MSTFWDDVFSFAVKFFACLISLFAVTHLSAFLHHYASLFGCTILFIYLSWKAAVYLEYNLFNEKLTSFKKAVFITGCDSGFGFRLALRLNRHGYRVFAGCLSLESRGGATLGQKAIFPKMMHVIKVDVTAEAEVAAARDFVKEECGRSGDILWAVVNNAGRLSLGFVDWGCLDDQIELMNVNAFGTVRVTRAFLPLLRESKGKRRAFY